MSKYFTFLLASLLGVFCFLSSMLSAYASSIDSTIFIHENGTSASQEIGLCNFNGEIIDCAEMGEKSIKTMLGLVIPILLTLIGGVFWLVMFIHAISNPIPNKKPWILSLLFLSIFGAIAYYFVIKRNYIKTINIIDIRKHSESNR